MENQPKTGKYALNFGLLLGAIGIIFALILYSMDLQYEQGWTLFIVNILIMAAVVCFGISQFKKANGGYLTLVQALKVGLGIALVAAIVSIIYQMIFINVIEPEFQTNVMEIRKNEMIAKNPGMTQEQVDGAVEMMEKFSGPTAIIIFSLVGSLFFGFLISLIGGLIMKKTPQQ